MTTVQIIGIVVASLALILLVVALIVTRRHGTTEEDETRHGGSFLGEAPRDRFDVLGKAERPVEDVTLDPALERAKEAELAALDELARERQPQPGGLGLDWGPDLTVREAPFPQQHTPAVVFEEDEITGEIPAAGTDRPSAGRLVPLSDIIVTTRGKMVDLDDPEVRRMLTELVTFEIDQAAEFRRQGQPIDAVLQLTEAEKVARALGMAEAAQRIRIMMAEVRSGH